jgi:hypothetical protein
MLTVEYDSRPGSIGETLRATAITAIAIATLVLAWRLRPAALTTAATPSAAVVLGCGWLAWALGCYLAVGVAATSTGHVIGAVRASGKVLTRLAPSSVSRLVEMAITFSVVTAVLGTTGTASAHVAARPDATSTQAPAAAQRDALDWPGLSDQRRPIVASPPASPHLARTDVTRRAGPAPSHRHRRAQVGLVSGSGSGSGTLAPPESTSPSSEIVVRAGDSLWSISARHLGPAASAQATAIAWHQWYAANRSVVGDDPDLIYPGQRLRAPVLAATMRPASSR